jgi:hypothetical protein
VGLLTLVGAAVLGTLVREQRLTRAQGELIGVAGALRTGAFLLPGELREIGADGDLLSIAPESLTYRAYRSAGLACLVTPSEIVVPLTPLAGYRQSQPGRDSILLFVEGDSVTSGDDRWLALPLGGLSTGRSCGGRPALSLSTLIDTVATPLGRIHVDAPLRTFEVMQLRLYASGSQYWLGARSVSAGETIQPVLGPLTGTGLRFTYLDSTASAAAGPSTVRTISLVLRATTARPVATGGNGVPGLWLDSLSTEFRLRNAPQP